MYTLYRLMSFATIEICKVTDLTHVPANLGGRAPVNINLRSLTIKDLSSDISAFPLCSADIR
jgi:hypothetical protein